MCNDKIEMVTLYDTCYVYFLRTTDHSKKLTGRHSEMADVFYMIYLNSNFELVIIWESSSKNVIDVIFDLT